MVSPLEAGREGEGRKRRSEGLKGRMRRKEEEGVGVGRRKGSGAWMDGERSEEGRYCLVAGDAAASSYTVKRLTTLWEPHLEEGKRRDRERRDSDSPTFISLSDPLLQGAVGK